jgi:hypothetical protein
MSVGNIQGMRTNGSYVHGCSKRDYVKRLRGGVGDEETIGTNTCSVGGRDLGFRLYKSKSNMRP